MEAVNRKISAALILASAAVLFGQHQVTLYAAGQQAPARLFANNLPSLRWLEFRAEGFKEPVSGVIFRPAEPPCCGVPLGGVATGCLDIDARGAFGFNALFNIIYPEKAFSGKKGNVFVAPLTRKLPDYPPFLGLSIGRDTWVLADKSILAGGKMETQGGSGHQGKPLLTMELSSVLDSRRFFCFARWHAKQATEFQRPRREGGLGAGGGAFGIAARAGPVGSTGQRASLSQECQFGG
jgi:hypothetical protein